MKPRRHVVIGAGPAGLTAAWQLARLGEQTSVLESDPEYVGGHARTVQYKGNRFDMGGHRFYSKSKAINQLWHQMLPDEFLRVPRMSRIHFEGELLQYPISPGEILRCLGPGRTAGIAASYIRARLAPRRPEESVEDWLINRLKRSARLIPLPHRWSTF